MSARTSQSSKWRGISTRASSRNSNGNKSIDEKIIEIESNECCWNNFRFTMVLLLLFVVNYIFRVHCFVSLT